MFKCDTCECIRKQWETVQTCGWFQHCGRHLCRLDETAEDWTPPGPVAVADDVRWVGNEWSFVCVELACLVTRTSPLPAWTHESRVCWVSCVSSWHVLSEGQVHYQRGHTSLHTVCWVSCVLSWYLLSEGQVHYQRGHTSLQCVESPVCWAGMSCQKDKSTTSVDTRV